MKRKLRFCKNYYSNHIYLPLQSRKKRRTKVAQNKNKKRLNLMVKPLFWCERRDLK